ncbi:unnamed protein product [Chondrus crispus]|uniref:Uncharacterized protein n=1 Tax=Chondrus crispus TaxID=2769 RepID=R7QNI4_CHOCR|nr:unnamed protein product [Chondrus crispus]CDF39348.1 unnamed protein product [Chondrus crispus]|eukprot:XP_005719259.1 unnamed protein product [Chondrus crispus]
MHCPRPPSPIGHPPLASICGEKKLLFYLSPAPPCRLTSPPPPASTRPPERKPSLFPHPLPKRRPPLLPVPAYDLHTGITIALQAFALSFACSDTTPSHPASRNVPPLITSLPPVETRPLAPKRPKLSTILSSLQIPSPTPLAVPILAT